MKTTTPIYEASQIAQTVLTFPDGLKSEITLSLGEDGYEILIEDEVHLGWTECEVFNIGACSEAQARRAFVMFVISYGR